MKCVEEKEKQKIAKLFQKIKKQKTKKKAATNQQQIL